MNTPTQTQGGEKLLSIRGYTGDVKIGGFWAISREGQPPFAYVAGHEEALQTCRAVNESATLHAQLGEANERTAGFESLYTGRFLEVAKLEAQIARMKQREGEFLAEQEILKRQRDYWQDERMELKTKLMANEAYCATLLAEGATRDTDRICALAKLYVNCPHAEITYNDDSNEGLIGWSLDVDGCEPISIWDPTLRGLCDQLIARAALQSVAKEGEQ